MSFSFSRWAVAPRLPSLAGCAAVLPLIWMTPRFVVVWFCCCCCWDIGCHCDFVALIQPEPLENSTYYWFKLFPLHKLSAMTAFAIRVIIFHFISTLYFCLWVIFQTFISALLTHAIQDSKTHVVTADQCTLNCTGIIKNNLVMMMIKIAKTSHWHFDIIFDEKVPRTPA